MKTLFLNDKENKFEIKEIEDDIEVFHELIDCRAFDMPMRTIGGKGFVIICDDEGLLNQRPITAINKARGDVMLVGSLLIVNNAPEGEIAGLSDEDIALIMNEIYTISYGKKTVKVINMDY